MIFPRIFPSWARNQVVYEVNLRQYTKAGTFQEFRQHLPRLKELGAGILWFMPIQPIGILHRKGSLGSYYSIRDYHEVDETYGTMEEFISLVKEIHDLGMFVILDWVANHTAWDHHWVKECPSFYRLNEKNEIFPPFDDWEDVVGLDYSNPGLRAAMISEMQFWIEQTCIDGFRCDMANLVPTGFWDEARAALDTLKPVFMLAEADQRELAVQAFDVLYNWNLFHVFNDIAKGKYPADEIRWRIPSEINDFPENAANLLFISNHDENSWNGSEVERLGLALETFAVLIFTLPGMPLIYSGMEAGNPRRLSFFDKDSIDWKEDKMALLYAKLARMRMETPALWNAQPSSILSLISTDQDDKILAFNRELGQQKVLVILNLSSARVDFHLSCTGCEGNYMDVLNLQLPVTIGNTPCFNLPAWGYRVFRMVQ